MLVGRGNKTGPKRARRQLIGKGLFVQICGAPVRSDERHGGFVKAEVVAGRGWTKVVLV